jgi:hypothetical protein
LLLPVVRDRVFDHEYGPGTIMPDFVDFMIKFDSGEWGDIDAKHWVLRRGVGAYTVFSGEISISSRGSTSGNRRRLASMPWPPKGSIARNSTGGALELDGAPS